jgi:hypothetical protein
MDGTRREKKKEEKSKVGRRRPWHIPGAPAHHRQLFYILPAILIIYRVALPSL